jgi:SNF2 family DNA or RNA helicase
MARFKGNSMQESINETQVENPNFIEEEYKKTPDELFQQSPSHPQIFYHKHNQLVLDQLQQEQFEKPALVSLHTEAEKFTIVRGFDKLLSMQMARGLISYQYQIESALKVLNRFRGRAMLCDEVGLGKTIEAGIILSEYVLRGLVRTVLILTPPSLMTQWQDEIASKFNIEFILSEDEAFKSMGTEAWKQFPRIIASINFARRKEHAEALAETPFDMVIVDEAHCLQNRATQTWKMVNSLKKKYMLLLTATPIQNSLEELYNMITLLKPGQLGTISEFKRTFMQRNDRFTPKNTPRLRELLNDAMIRNTRSLTQVQLPNRHARTIPLQLTSDERAVYDGLTEFIKQQHKECENSIFAFHEKKKRAGLFTLRLLQEEVGSSVHAVLPTLEKISQDKSLNSDGHKILTELQNLGSQIQKGVKTEALLDVIHAHQDKIIVFTKFIKTLEHICDTLSFYGIPFVKFMGGMSMAQKVQAVEVFQKDAQLLVSTEIGGEGLNLQFCNAVLNYDLPWNPLRIEQRIGRVHRVGQAREVEIFNFAAEDTIEAYILHLLDTKINMFELVIGELDMILGNLQEQRDFEEIIYEIWIRSQTQQELEQQMESLGDQLIAAKKEYIRTKEYDDRLFGDYFHA